MATPMTPLCPLRNDRAERFAVYLSSLAALSTFCAVSGAILGSPRSAYDAVARETPAALATSLMVTMDAPFVPAPGGVLPSVWHSADGILAPFHYLSHGVSVAIVPPSVDF